MPKCSKCKSEIEIGNNFCSRCGNKAEVKSVSQPEPVDQPKAQEKPQTQTQNSQTPAQPVANPKKKSSGTKILVGCLIVFLVFLVIGGIVGFILVKKGLKIATEEYSKIEDEWSGEIEDLKEMKELGDEFIEETQELKDEAESSLNNLPNTETKKDKSTKKASKVVEEFMACTLGTIPNKCPTDNKDKTAKEHLTMGMRADYNSDTFVPYNYCIQQGPDNVKIISETESSSFAYVTVSAKYGSDEYVPSWMFTLIKQDGEWKIKAIQCLRYDIQ